MPTTRIDATLSLKDRVARKIDTIRRILGHDQQILDSTERFDPEAVSAIYQGKDEVLDSEMVGLLNFGESKAENDANKIRKDETRLKHIENLPFGIRSVSGKGKLLIACEAEEVIINEKNEKIFTRSFRRHYEITSKETRMIWTSTFLKQLGDNNNVSPGDMDLAYNDFVVKGWTTFGRDMKNTMARKSILKHQTYFDKKLMAISKDSDIGREAASLLPFVRQMMLVNHQPYKKLDELRKRIDRDSTADEHTIITGLMEIRQKYEQTKYQKYISKPRILYSMMINT